MAVVVIGVDAEHAFEVATARDEEPVEAFASDGADEALCDRVRFRRSHRRLDHAEAFAGEDSIKVAGELAVAVADQEAKPARLLLERPGELASLLVDPRSVGIGGAASDVDAAACQFDEEEDIEALQRDCLDGEEVDGEHAAGLLAQERAP